MGDAARKEYIPVRYEFERRPEEEMLARSDKFYKLMKKRRSIRMFSNEPVPKEILENCIRTAGTAPSGANRQPWTFCLIESQDLRKQIREAAEKEEHENYAWRMSDEWKNDLAHLGTDDVKPYLETAPYLIVVFKHTYGISEGKRIKNYYINESVGIASGMLIAALHNAGFVHSNPYPKSYGVSKRDFR